MEMNFNIYSLELHGTLSKDNLEAAFSTLDLVFQKNNWPNSQILRCVFMTDMTKYSHKKLQKFVKQSFNV